MRLLLTSSGITNSSIVEALGRLLGQPFEISNLAFVPTAANVELGDKGWLIDDLWRLKNLQFKQIDLVDISAIDSVERLKEADVIVFGGGNTPHLLNTLASTGVGAALPEILQTRVYMGISAGSISAGRAPVPAISNDFYGEGVAEALNLVDLIFLPHLNSPLFPNAREENIRDHVKDLRNVYALDDESALVIVDGTVEVVTEGNYLVFNS